MTSLPQTRQAPFHFKRILIVRTDRIGDVLLSTPVIKALRDEYPSAYLAVMVSPYTRDVVEGNPFLNEVIIYDKDSMHRGWLATIKFAIGLRNKQFDLAVILHPLNRVHLLTFFAGIPRRVGYDRKLGFLLTDRIKHTKHLGEKHEIEYNLDLLRYLGMHPKEKSLFMPTKAESENWAQQFLAKEGIGSSDKLLAVHPGASCISKLWPAERFAEVADRMAEKYGVKVLIVAGPKDAALGRQVVERMKYHAINLAGSTSVSQLASIFRRCVLLISNDSGPVHIASAAGAAVIAIFGRNQKGLGPVRWGPVGNKAAILHKDTGCTECLAHNCVRGFACIKAISVEEVLKTADSLLAG
jgi:heptosyltransferase-2